MNSISFPVLKIRDEKKLIQHGQKT